MKLVLAGSTFVAILASAAQSFVNPTKLWLSIKGFGNETEAGEYYASIRAPATLSEWKAKYGFDGVNETRAIYYNAADLGFGRDMHCRRWTGVDIACYVVNPGFGPAGPAGWSANAAIDNKNTLATAAMAYVDAVSEVSFYV